MFDKLLAAVALAVCALLLVRLLLGRRKRLRFDAAARRTWATCHRLARAAVGWRASRRQAAAVAQDAIRRARSTSTREGNVIRPKSFRRPRKPH